MAKSITPDSPTAARCQDCGRHITVREANAYWDEAAPIGEYPRICSDCNDIAEMMERGIPFRKTA